MTHSEKEKTEETTVEEYLLQEAEDFAEYFAFNELLAEQSYWV